MRSTAAAAAVVLVTLIYPIGRGPYGVHSGLMNTGPYNLKMIRHELCEDQGTAEGYADFHIIKKSTHKTFMHGTAIVPFDYDDTVHTQLNFSRRGSQGWGKNAYKMKSEKFCTEFRDNYPTLFVFFFKAWGIEKPSCPIKKGNYTMDMDTDLPRLTKLAFLPYGTYRLDYALLHGNPPVRFVCNTWYITCTERPR